MNIQRNLRLPRSRPPGLAGHALRACRTTFYPPVARRFAVSLHQQSTLAYLAALTDDELKRIVILHDAPEERFTVDGLLCTL